MFKTIKNEIFFLTLIVFLICISVFNTYSIIEINKTIKGETALKNSEVSSKETPNEEGVTQEENPSSDTSSEDIINIKEFKQFMNSMDNLTDLQSEEAIKKYNDKILIWTGKIASVEEKNIILIKEFIM